MIVLVAVIVIILYVRHIHKKKSIGDSGYTKSRGKWDYRSISKNDSSKYSFGNDYGAQFQWMNPNTGKADSSYTPKHPVVAAWKQDAQAIVSTIFQAIAYEKGYGNTPHVFPANNFVITMTGNGPGIMGYGGKMPKSDAEAIVFTLLDCIRYAKAQGNTAYAVPINSFAAKMIGNKTGVTPGYGGKMPMEEAEAIVATIFECIFYDKGQANGAYVVPTNDMTQYLIDHYNPKIYPVINFSAK